ncbi:MAG TPA: patatin-like phospholipase family protein, partial [Candidatus Binatia bacterium]
MATSITSLREGIPVDHVIEFLKTHEYFRGVGDAILSEIARFGAVTDYDADATVHQLNDPLASIHFVLRGRVKAVRVDSRGDEHLFQTFTRGEQYGMILGGLGESLPLRVFALEPSTILSLDHEKAMELTLLYPDLRRQWLQSYARSLRHRLIEPSAGQRPRLLAMIHQSPATRNLAQKIIARLQGLGEAVCVLSDSDSWRSVPDVQFRSLLDGERVLETAEIRRQVGDWSEATRLVLDTTAAQHLDWAALLNGVHCALVFIRPREVSSAIEWLRSLDIAARGWLDEVVIVWVLDESTVAPDIPEVHDFAKREFKIAESPLPHPWGKVHSTGIDRLIHYLRGVRIGVALGGGAARGMAHLGVLKVLHENGIVPDVIVGTSVGAMTGILYSAGLDSDYLVDTFAADLKLPWIFRQ